VIISTKTNAKSGKEAEKSLENSLQELNMDYVDIFLLHFVKSDWINGCHQVLKELNDLKRIGSIKAVGLSTHSVKVVRQASDFREVDVLMTICCKTDQATISKFERHIPLEDGSVEEMHHALRLAHNSGKGVIAMKVLGASAPPLVKNYQSALKSVAQLDFVDAMVIGMRNLDEVKKNVKAILSA